MAGESLWPHRGPEACALDTPPFLPGPLRMPCPLGNQEPSWAQAGGTQGPCLGHDRVLCAADCSRRSPQAPPLEPESAHTRETDQLAQGPLPGCGSPELRAVPACLSWTPFSAQPSPRQSDGCCGELGAQGLWASLEPGLADTPGPVQPRGS